MSRIAFCTIATRSHLAHARALGRTLLEHNPDSRLYLLLADAPANDVGVREEPFRTLGLCDLGDAKGVSEMTFYYDRFEFCNALKGMLHAYMFERTDEDAWIYLDADIQVFASLDPVACELQDCSILLSPHHETPAARGFVRPVELNLLRYGLYNGGFLGVRRTEEARAFIDWFRQRLMFHCLFEVEQGFFVDQLWLNLVPLFFNDAVLLRHPGANVGYWNLHERPMWRDGSGCLHVGSQRMLFFHFSQWKYDDPGHVAIWQSGVDATQRSLLSEMGYDYRTLLRSCGYESVGRIPYGFDRWETGELVSKAMRRAYLDLVQRGASPCGAPFSVAAKSRLEVTRDHPETRWARLRRWGRRLVGAQRW